MHKGAPSPALPGPTDQGKPQAAETIKFYARMLIRKHHLPELQGERSINSPCALEISPAPAALPPRWDPSGCRLERRRKREGRRLACAGSWSQCASSPLSPPLSQLLCCWSRGMGSPCLFFPSQLFLSLRLLHYSPHPSAFFLFLGTPAHPAVMSALISLTWPWPRPSCALALDSSLCLLVF
jgi:hypothetical protein